MGKKGRKAGERREPDYVLILVVAALLLLGLLMVYSTTFDRSYRETESPFHYLERQALWAGLGLAIAAILTWLEYEWLRRMAVPIMGMTLILLVLVLFVGQERFGARRNLLEGSVQPGELAKLTTVIYIATWVSSKGEQIRDVTYGLVPFAVLIGLLAGLVVLQPDLSTAAVIVMTGLATFFVGGADLLQLVIGGVVGGAVFSGLVLLYPHAQRRLHDFFVMLRDPSQMSYHAQESLITLGSGGMFGSGLGLGRQKFGHLPFPFTDSIFAVIGEELGLVGCLLVLGLYALLCWRGLRIALRARGGFGVVLACGLTVLLASQALINVGVVVGVLPFTGMVLPFISLGGSSLLVSLAGVGILLSISRGGHPREWRGSAHLDFGRRDGGTRLSRAGRSASS
ncbi:MAG: FtsW/RodA/SpoVE family cell cycle protein [Anaerolineae bacterium]|jgi:cell division protein FtsW